MNNYLVNITNLPENQFFKLLFRKTNTIYFCFGYKKNNTLYNLYNHKQISWPVFHVETTNRNVAKYFINTYKSSYLKAEEGYNTLQFLNSLSVLRFFKLKYETALSLENKNKIIKKWSRYVTRYLSLKTVKPFLKELRKCNDINIILSFWPIELGSIKKPWNIQPGSIFTEHYFRYIENLKYYNYFPNNNILTADFEKEHTPLMQDLRNRWKELIEQKKEDAYSILDKEFIEAQKNNDVVSQKEIQIVKKTIRDEIASIDYNIFNTPNSLFKFWPNILYPGPEPVKV